MTPAEKTTIGIIGYGKFAKLLEELILERQLLDNYLSGVNLKISSRSNPIDNSKFFALSEIAQCDFIIPTVPIKYFEGTIQTLAPLLKEKPGRETTIIDVCSVKIHPKKVLLENLGELSHVNIISSHPNFGPESFRLNNQSLKGLNFICENLRCRAGTYQKFRETVSDLGLNLQELDADTHDRTIGVAHFTSMLIGHVLSTVDLERPQFAAASTVRMFEMIDGVGNDLEILQDMYQFNPYCKNHAEAILETTKQIYTKL